MFRPKQMTKISVVGPKHLMRDTIREFHDLKIMHIKDYVKKDEKDFFDIGAPLDEADSVSKTLVKIRALLAHMPAGEGKAEVGGFKEIEKNAENIETFVFSRTNEISRIEGEIDKLNEGKARIDAVKAVGLSLDAFDEYGSIKYIFGYVNDYRFEDKIKGTKNFEIFKGESDGKHVVAIFVKKDEYSKVHSALAESGYAEINTDGIKGLKGSADKKVAEIEKEIKALEDKKKSAENEIAETGKKWGAYLALAQKKLEDESDISEAPLRFSVSGTAFVADGWVPTEKYEMITKRLTKNFGDKVYVKKYDKAGEAPIELDTKEPVKSFGFFLDLYSLPSYKELDPSFFMFLTFPLFFGFMLGDWGYGLLTLAIFTAVKKKMPALKGVLNVMSIAAISTTFFGLLFDEFFGFELFHEFGIHFPHLATRVEPEGAEALLGIAIIMGIVHISVGYLVGFVNEYKNHGFKTAFMEKIGWIIYMAGFFPAMMSFFSLKTFEPGMMNIFIGLIAVGAVIILKGEGIKGALELVSPLTNALSYARLMAVGLVSAVLAFVVDQIAESMIEYGPIGYVIAAVAFIGGHAIAIFIGLLSPFIHSMRLHYVEFFLKFYHGGGKKYMPFGLRKD